MIKQLKKTINSVINQNYKNIEYIIIDGGSTDDTIKIINQYRKNFSKFISEKDNGIYSAINKGIKLATGDIISVLHSDDFYFNEKVLSDVVNSFIINENLECLIGTTIMKKIIRKYFKKIFSNKF